ncbi:MAG: hypothetical protein CL946_06030 [Ectothiorhodospiraceae bacterium]|nr:hypothetical protein [Ectothiorhodospiraceae bacterium]
MITRFISISLLLFFLAHSTQSQSVTAEKSEASSSTLIGTMINTYTVISRWTNQIAYDWEHDVYTVIYRGGPNDIFRDDGRGELVLSSSFDGGYSWTGVSPDSVINKELPNSQGYLYARHPSVLTFPWNGATKVSAISSQLDNGFTQFTDYRELFSSAGYLAGPLVGDKISDSNREFYIPSRIVRDRNGRMYSMVRTFDPITHQFSGKLLLLKSQDEGSSWDVKSGAPVLDSLSLPPLYKVDEDAMSFDVSPDGSVIYLGFIAQIPGEDTTAWQQNLFGWTRSTDEGESWSEPALYDLAQFEFHNLPTGGLDVSNGWIYRSIATAVDGLNQPHFLLTINGGERDFSAIDSTLLGEVTIDPSNPSAAPEFFTLTAINTPRFRRYINAANATGPEQPVFLIHNEHEWSKTPDGMNLVAKWIDTRTYEYEDPHWERVVKDSIHDVFLARKSIANRDSHLHGWDAEWPTWEVQVRNVSNSDRVDEKFTKIHPIYNPVHDRLGIIYTIMGDLELVHHPGDANDLETAELFIINAEVPVAVNTPPQVTQGIRLSQNYPNPFSAATNITYEIHTGTEHTLAVYDMLGKRIAVLAQGRAEAGAHTAEFHATGLPAGVYQCVLTTASAREHLLMRLVR